MKKFNKLSKPVRGTPPYLVLRRSQPQKRRRCRCWNPSQSALHVIFKKTIEKHLTQSLITFSKKKKQKSDGKNKNFSHNHLFRLSTNTTPSGSLTRHQLFRISTARWVDFEFTLLPQQRARRYWKTGIQKQTSAPCPNCREDSSFAVGC